MYLFLDSSKSNILFSLFTDTEIIKIVNIESNQDHTIKLYEAFKELDINYKDIDRLYVVNGPGSYTGLRIGMIFAKTIAMEYSVPIYPVGLMEIMYLSADRKKVALDAKGKRFYVFDGINTSIIPTQEVTDEVICEELDLSKILLNEYVSNIKAVNYRDLDINYVKPAI